jgi:hypothetical protein
MKNISERKLLNITYLLIVIFIAFLSTLVNWTPGGESWGYWFFNRELQETGTFVVNDRSPLFTIYLSLFSWLNYPSNIILQHAFSSILLILSFLYLFRNLTWLPLILIASAAWLPFILVSEPPTQVMALTFSNFALGYRVSKESNLNLSIFYFLLFCSFLFRGTYVILLIAFIVYDLYLASKKGYKLNYFAKNIKSNIVFFVPLLIIVLLTFLRQSPHPLNNAWFASTDWMPNDGKSMTNASFIQSYHERYITKTYGECCLPEHHMYYKETGPFNSASNIITAINQNPVFILEEVYVKSQEYIGMLARLANYNLQWVTNKHGIAYKLAKLAGLFIVVIIIYFALSFSRGKPALTILVISTIISSGLTIFLNFPKPRYLVMWAPVFIFSYLWAIHLIRYKLFKFLKIKNYKINKIIALAIMFFILKYASFPSLYWDEVKININNSINTGQISMLENWGENRNSNKINSIKSVINRCSNVLATTDALFIGAFTEIKLKNVTDYWIFPPSDLEKIDYTKYLDLKFDCIFVPHKMTKSKDYQFTNFILPLQEDIIQRGGNKITLPYYGYVTILANKSNIE